jgi:hypothetical protein
MAASLDNESENVVHLKGTAANPARDPKQSVKEGKGSRGDKAAMDAYLIIALAWIGLIVLTYSLRYHNV